MFIIHKGSIRELNAGETDLADVIQQGDVPVVPVATKIIGPHDGHAGRAVLALGEVTGHMHVIDSPRAKLVRVPEVLAALRQELIEKGILDPDADVVDAGLVIDGDDPVMLRHDEHDAHSIQPGNYAVLRQREYAPGAVPRRVAD